MVFFVRQQGSLFRMRFKVLRTDPAVRTGPLLLDPILAAAHQLPDAGKMGISVQTKDKCCEKHAENRNEPQNIRQFDTHSGGQRTEACLNETWEARAQDQAQVCESQPRNSTQQRHISWSEAADDQHQYTTHMNILRCGGRL